MNKKGAKKWGTGTIILALVLAAIVGVYGDHQGWWANFKPASVAGGTTTGGNSGSGQTQLAQIQPSVLVQPSDKYNGTILAGSMTVFINGVKTSGTAGTAFNVPQGGTYEAVFDDGQHYQSRTSGSAPVNGQAPAALTMYPNGTLSSTFYNSAGTAATAQALGAGDIKYVKTLLTSTSKKTFSNPDSDKNPIICFDYNTTEIDTIEVQGGTPAPMPQEAVGTYEECDFAPFKTLSDGQEQTISILVDADDSLNPACATDPTMVVYDQDLYLKTKDPVDARAFGVENDAGSDVGGVNPTVTLDCS